MVEMQRVTHGVTLKSGMVDDNTLILDFFLGTGTDHKGRTLSHILAQDDHWLERIHDHIQWLFPLYVRSRFCDQAPLLTDGIREAFLRPEHPLSDLLQENFSAAINRMLRFYGYEICGSDCDRFQRAANWDGRLWNWLTPGNHNHLRMTRMLRCMTLLGRHPLAVACRDAWAGAASERPGCVSRETSALWNEAVDTVPALNP